MKTFFLTGLCLSWLCYGFSQAPQSLPQKLNHFFAPIDKTQTQTGYLLDLVVGLENTGSFSGVSTDTIHADINRFGLIYGQLVNSKCAPIATLPSASPARE